jgi:tetratricopeptide (TPR) repeat protein
LRIKQARQIAKNTPADLLITACTKIIRGDAKAAWAYDNRGIAYNAKGDNDRAIADCSMAIEINPKFAHAYNNRGHAYNAKGDIDRTIADYNRTIEIDPKFASAYNNRGNAYDAKGDNDRAIADYNKAIEYDPKYAKAYNNRGNAYRSKGDYDRSIIDYNKSIEYDPKYAKAYNNRGIAYRHKGEYDRAIADYNRAIEIDAKNALAYNNRGWAYYLKGDYDRAISDASASIILDPKYKNAYHTRGESYRAKGTYARALVDFKQALSLDPTHVAAIASLGMTYEAMGDREKAIESYSRTQSLPATTNDVKDYQAEAAKRLAALKNSPTASAQPATAANATAPAVGHRIALLIGNQLYAEKVGPLKNPHSDVAILEDALKKVGFEVPVVRDTDYRSMDLAIKRHISKIREAGGDAIDFFYYSGHGAANPVTRINYLIPVDVADAETDDFWNQAFELSDIVDKLSSQAPDATHYVVFDACRDELKLKQSGKSLGGAKGFVPVVNTSGLLIAYATAPNKIASDFGAGSGPYARALAEEIVKPGQEAVTMFRNVQLRVKAAIGLDPWLSFPTLRAVYFAGEQGPQSATAKK